MVLRSALLLALCVLRSICCPSYTLKMSPRIIQDKPAGGQSIPLPMEERNAVFYLDAQRSLYIGGQTALYQLDFQKLDHPLSSLHNNCKIHVTFLGLLNGKLMVCGTNASKPICCKMDGKKAEEVPRALSEQLSPLAARANYNILITGNDVYSTIPRRSNNAASTRTTIFRKIDGKEPFLYTSSNLMRNPLFVKSLAVERRDPVQNKIFLFFMEDNTEIRTTQKKVPMIVQICKEENGSEKPDIRNMFCTALKTRLMCGDQEGGQYYPFLQDIYFLKTQDLIYGLFTNAWNHSAVCSYKVEDIELVFGTSDLFGSSRRDLKMRPGTCLHQPQRTPQETSDEANIYPELTSWVWPLSNQTVFQTLYYYRKLVVDEITAVDNNTYKVIILATDNGYVHKVVEFDDGASNILELHPFSKGGKILHLELDPNKTEHVLYLGSAHEVSRLPLDDCSAYRNSCASCVLARDPYCGWSNGVCQSILRKENLEVVQNLTAGAMCSKQEKPFPGQKESPHTFPTKTNVSPPSTYFLTCPADSKQATYWWKNGDKVMEKCTPHEGKCYLLFNHVTHPGEYQCIAQKLSTERVVSKYELMMENNSERTQYSWLVVLSASFCAVHHMV